MGQPDADVEGSPSHQRALTNLDGTRVQRSLERKVLLALDFLWGNCTPEDRRILSPFGNFLIEHAAELAEIRTRAPGGELPNHFHQTHPVCTALLRYQSGDQFEGLTRLLCITVAAAIESASSPEAQRARIDKLTSNIRGAIKDPQSNLRLILRGTGTLPELVRKVERELDQGGSALHKDFATHWKDWIRDTIIRWIHADPDALREGLRPSVLVPDLEGPTVEVGGLGAQEPDDQTEIQIALTSPVAPDAKEPVKTSCLKAWARALVRASHVDLSLPVDQLAPDELIAQLAKASLATAQRALQSGQPVEAEPPAALGFALATGLRELDLGGVVWGNSAAGRLAVVDPLLPRMFRTVVRPAKRTPSPDLDGWIITTTDEVAWPLPPSLHQILKALASSGQPIPGSPVLPLRNATASRRYRLWDVGNELIPESGLAPSQARLVLAAELAQSFGPEVSQLLLGDTFCTSVAPAHYPAFQESLTCQAVARIQQRWFGETSVLTDTARIFGSRLVLTDEAAQRWPAQLRRGLKSAAHRKAVTGLEAWVLHRDHLAAALSAATGARPGNWVGAIDLDQFIPEFGLVILSDKASDLLRKTRIAATGRRWMADLRTYLDRLIAISQGSIGESAAMLAGRILRSEAPLFSVIDADGLERAVSAADLRATMPLPLQAVPNHYRHRLNQALQRRLLDPELRHAQLGWVVTPAHTLADHSHWSAKAFGERLSSILDEIMVSDCWYPPTQRTPAWSWDGVPIRPFKDWAQAAREHESEHQAEQRRVKQLLRERWESVSKDVSERLAVAISEYFPALRLNVTDRRLEWVTHISKNQSVEMTTDHHGLLCDRVRMGDKSPGDATEAIATRILLYRLVVAARRKGIVRGPIPSRPFTSTIADASPFLPGLGLAVRHAEAIRYALMERASKGRAHDQGPLAAATLLAFSGCRQLDGVLAAVAAASEVQRSAFRSDRVRVATAVNGRISPMVFGGLPALALARRRQDAPTARAPTQEQFGAWCADVFQWPSPDSGSGQEMVAQLEGAFQAAGRLELSGPERIVMLRYSPLAAVPVGRSLARDDDWPLRTAIAVQEPPDPLDGQIHEVEPVHGDDSVPAPRKPRSLAENYERLTAALNPETLPKLLGKKSDGHYGWRGSLEKYLADLHTEVGVATNLGLLVGFVRHRLRYGGRVRRKLAHATLGSDLTRFASDLLGVAAADRILDWDADEYRLNYLALILGKSLGARRQAFDALMLFHEYLIQVHHAPEVSVAELRSLAGQRLSFVDPGMVTQREVERTLAELLKDLETELARPDATPEFVRLLELRAIMYEILEASGIRPSSAFGLTLGDLVFLGPGRDFVRIRTTGAYGRAKSNASHGFTPMQGTLWETSRSRVIAWLDREKQRLDGTPWWKVPLFAIAPGARRRFDRSYLTRRIDELLKWACADKKARTYWLRKNRVTARHEGVAEKSLPMARETYGTLCISGHASILTPMASYISDPGVIYCRSLQDGEQAPRGAVLDVTGLDGAKLDMAWLRAGGANSKARMPIVLGRLGLEPQACPAERITDPPPLNRGKTITAQHLADFARAMAQSTDREEATFRSGLTIRQVDRLEKIASDLVRMRGVTPWPVPGLRHISAVMAIPRSLTGTDKLFDLLQKPPEFVVELAESWAQQAYPDRLHGPGTIMQLSDRAEQDAARMMLGTTGIDMVLDQSAGVEILRTPDGAAPSRSHAAALQWVFAITWIFARFKKQ